MAKTVQQVVTGAWRRLGLIVEDEGATSISSQTANQIITSALRRLGVMVEEEGITSSITTTALTILTSAYRRQGIISEDEAPTAEQGVTGLSLLNRMMAGWSSEGIAYAHTTQLGVSTVVALPDYLLRALEVTLGNEIALMWGKTITEASAMQVTEAKGSIRAHFVRTARGLTVLNDMLGSLASEGIAFNHTAVANLTATVNIPGYLIRGVEWLLATDLSSEYGIAELTETQTAEAMKAKAALKAHYFKLTRGVSVLNDLMSGFEAEGIEYIHADLTTLSTTVNVPDHLVRSLEWVLAGDIADEEGKPLTPDQSLKVDRGRNALQAYYTPVPRAQTDEGILNRRRGPYGTIYRA